MAQDILFHQGYTPPFSGQIIGGYRTDDTPADDNSMFR